ncbi:MAG: peroxidase family protein [Thermosynechococcaceae cyanobacterium]
MIFDIESAVIGQFGQFASLFDGKGNIPNQTTPPPLLTFSLVDAVTNQGVAGYEDLRATPEINLSNLDLTTFSLVAQVNPNHPDARSVQSIVFESPQGNRTENVAPYALFGDINGDFRGQDLSIGDYTIKATAYTKKRGRGDEIASLDLDYTVETSAIEEPVIEARSLDGSGNNLSDPSLGQVGTNYSRDAGTNYADGIGQPIEGPDPRFISNRIYADQAQNLFSENGVTQWAGYWGQFIDHTIGLRQEGTENAPIPFDSNDPLEAFQNDLGSIGFERSQSAPGTGITTPREQVNVVSSFIDGWAIYGGSEERLEWLREGPVDGDLSNNSARLLLTDEGYLPPATARGDASIAPTMDLFGRLAGTPDQRIIAGDVRANQSIPLTTIHTLFAREHNRIVDELPEFLGEETKFQIARKVVGAQQQYITYTEFLPAMGINLDDYQGYDATVDPSITNEFATVGFRAHSQIHGELEIETEADRFSAEQLESFEAQGIEVELVGDEVAIALPLTVAIGQPALVSEIGLDLVSAALAGEPQYKNDEQIDNQLRSILFQLPSDPSGELDGPDLPNSFSTVADLGALDVQRGRDHGIPLYNDLREAYGLE